MIIKLSNILLVSIALHAATVRAEDTDGKMFSFHGFGTIGVVHSSERNADFVGSFLQANGVGYSSAWSAALDSKLGLQMDAKLAEKLSAVIQITAQHNSDNSYFPDVEWANIKYQITPNFNIRFGRTVVTPAVQSDVRLVGYSFPWVRLPPEVYGLLPLTHKDGIDATYRHDFGDVRNSIQISYGQSKISGPGGSTLKAPKVFDASNTIEYGAVTMRLGYTAVRSANFQGNGSDELLNRFSQFGNTVSALPGMQSTGAQALAIVDKFNSDAGVSSTVALGVNYDPGPWFLSAEWVKFKAANFGDSTGWHATGGYRIGKFTPYLTFARADQDRLSFGSISTVGLPPDLTQTAVELNAILGAFNSAPGMSHKTVSAGMRWDFAKDVALKVQYDHISFDSNSSGGLINIQPDFRPGGNVRVFSATLDFLF